LRFNGRWRFLWRCATRLMAHRHWSRLPRRTLPPPPHVAAPARFPPPTKALPRYERRSPPGLAAGSVPHGLYRPVGVWDRAAAVADLRRPDDRCQMDGGRADG